MTSWALVAAVASEFSYMMDAALQGRHADRACIARVSDVPFRPHPLTGPSLSSRHLCAAYAGQTIPKQDSQAVAAAVDHRLNLYEPGHRSLRPRAVLAAVEEPSVP